MSERHWLRSATTAFVLLLLLTVGVQALHVDPLEGPSASPCMVCVSTQTNAPVAIVVTSVLLVEVASAFIPNDPAVPSFEATLSLFVRPPPSL
jgi:hypothetical protein